MAEAMVGPEGSDQCPVFNTEIRLDISLVFA
jgi:hypothetical protein